VCVHVLILKGILCHYAPKVHKLYANTKASLKDMHPHLVWNFHNSVFAATTFNLGPATVTFDHTDNGNFASGMCSITALGDFNPTNGGHLVLFDLGLIIQFPPGATILIPSAILRHGNIPIAPLERTRMPGYKSQHAWCYLLFHTSHLCYVMFEHGSIAS
jgi:hypothetical protein